MSPSNNDANVASVPVKGRAGGIKLIVKKRNRKRTFGLGRALVTTKTRGIPQKPPKHAKQQQQQETTPESTVPDAHDCLEDSVLDEEIPCDTLLAIRSLQQTKTCLDIPLFIGTVPSVLESQLHDKLQSHDDYDSIVTSELQQLTRSNKIRRLTSSGNSIIVEAVLETRHYKRAIWDAHRHYHGSNPNVTANFVLSLDQLTKRQISKTDLQECWPNAKIAWNDHHVDILVQMQVLLPVKDDAYIFWLPHWGLVLKQLTKAQQKVTSQLKRSLYKELSQTQLERMHHSGFSGPFVLHTLVAQGLVELQDRPSGSFVRLVKST
jgi:hypothetical protein